MTQLATPTSDVTAPAPPHRAHSRALRHAWALIPLLGLIQLDFLLMTHLPAWHVSYSTLHFDRFAFGGTVPTVWLQDLANDSHGTRWWDLGATLIYATHFLLWPLAVIALWLMSRAHFVRVAAALLIATAAGYATYALIPTGPPWLASKLGLMPPVDRVVVQVLNHHHLDMFVVAFPNTEHLDLATVGAIPSLHAAYPMLFLLSYLSTGGRRFIIPLVTYVTLMALTLVYTGEHFVGDIVIGWIYAAVAVTIVDLRWRWLRSPEEVRRRRHVNEAPMTSEGPTSQTGQPRE
ncbi:MAG: phosphatase PAP2 family protein [Thermoleophilia bacterium]|nr:phosphatase PAP2 family protein [Thermoleophilia bacterium]